MPSVRTYQAKPVAEDRNGDGPWNITRFLLLALTLYPASAAAQVRVAVDGQLQNVPRGVVRTISYSPGGPQTISDEVRDGAAMPGTAKITTTETTDHDDDGNPTETILVTRIEPISATAYSPATMRAIRTPSLSPLSRRGFAPQQERPLESELAGQDLPDAAATASPLRILRDPQSGQFVTTIRINGIPVHAIVDTGADSTILSARDARATGAIHDITRSEPMAGIGGMTMLNVTHVRSMNIGGHELSGFSAMIGQEGIPYTLLGQPEIARLGRIVIENGVMTISPRG